MKCVTYANGIANDSTLQVGALFATKLGPGKPSCLTQPNKKTSPTSGVANAVDQGNTVVAPLFTLSRVDRKSKISLASLRGKVVVLNSLARDRRRAYARRGPGRVASAGSRSWRQSRIVFSFR